MRAITISEPGGPEVLVEHQVPDPQPGPGEVVIDVVSAGINRADLLQRVGKYPPPPGASTYPGLECAGRISAVAGDVTDWRVGDEVCALLAGGGYADRVAVPAGQVLPVPSGIPLVEAATLPEAVCTVWSTIFAAAQLSPGDRLLVHGGSGGIGTIALQLASAYGVRVFCTASARKANRLTAYGAERVIDYRREDFRAIVAAATDGNGVDVILDHVGGEYLSRNIDALATGGRLVVIGVQGGRKAEVDLGKLLNKRASIIASTLRSRPVAEKASIVADVRNHVWPLVESGAVKPVIDQAFAMADAAEAHRYFERGDHIGKILLVR